MPDARAAARSHSSAAISTRRGESSASCCRRRCRRSRGGKSRCRGSRHQASAATASTPSPSDPAASAFSIADVVGKGIPAALLMSNLQAAVRAFATDTTEPAELCPAGQPHPVRPHRRRPLHLVLLLHRRQRRVDARLCKRRPLPSVVIRANGDGRAVWRPEGRCSASSRTAATNRAASRFAAAIASSSTPMASPTSATPTTKNSATARLVDLGGGQSRVQRAGAPGAAGRRRRAFSDGRFQDDATLIVMAAE